MIQTLQLRNYASQRCNRKNCPRSGTRRKEIRLEAAVAVFAVDVDVDDGVVVVGGNFESHKNKLLKIKFLKLVFLEGTFVC